MRGSKILVMSTTFPRWKNDSIPRFVYDLSNRLASAYSITILAPHFTGALKEETMEKMHVRRFVYFIPESMQKLCYEGGMMPNMQKSLLAKIQIPLLLISEFFSAYKIINMEKISMLHAHWMLPQGLVGILLKKIFKIKLLVTIHGSDIFALNSLLFRKMQHLVLKNSDFITANSIATKNELLRRFPKYSNKIRIIPMGIDINLFKKSNVKKPKKHRKNRILLFVGRLSDQKGLQYLIDSMPEVLRHDTSAKLLIIGEGAYKAMLEQKIKDKGLGKNVEFLGSMPPSEIAKYHNLADVFILPSLSGKTGTEALGLSLLEAMSSGCAVIGTNVGGIPFAIKNGHNGILVNQRNPHELSNAIIMLLKDRKKASMFGNNAARYARKNYSWNKIANDFLKIYGELLK